ncbi:hypothetical protein TNCV_5128551 [Trichonephila clavipes]|nr:hypothetical protein TNCV_5128551 [Trichonephila clavipes]
MSYNLVPLKTHHVKALSRLERHLVGVVWKLRERDASSGVVLITFDHESKLRSPSPSSPRVTTRSPVASCVRPGPFAFDVALRDV